MSSSVRDRVENAIDIDADRRIFRTARSSYVDRELYEAEMKSIFSKCWLYVGHDSELSGPNDFKTRTVAGRSIIFVRDNDGAVQCFLNICPHRGAQICREREGNTKAFHCIYHGWSFEEFMSQVGRYSSHLHIVDAYAIFKDKMKSIQMCTNRFDTDTKTSFIDLYTKIDGGEDVTSWLQSEPEQDSDDSEDGNVSY